VLPILHLNGYKIANPTVFARIPPDELNAFLRGNGWDPLWVEIEIGDEHQSAHRRFAAVLDKALDGIAGIQRTARDDGGDGRPAWPMIVLRSPKGWTGPAQVDGLPVEGTWRSHQVPLAGVRENPEHLRALEQRSPPLPGRRHREGSTVGPSEDEADGGSTGAMSSQSVDGAGGQLDLTSRSP